MSNLNGPPSLSIVIPAYNEEARLPATLETVWSYLRTRPYPADILIVDDGSRDATPRIVSEFGRDKPVRLLSSGHRGKGGAVRQGMLAAEGDFILMTDADLSTPIEDLEPLLRAATEGYDVVIGSRALKDSTLIVRQPFYREMMGRTGNLLIQTLLLPGIHDTQCGFKLFRRDAAREIFSRSVMSGMSFDIEVLYLARRLGYTIKEMPVRWSHRPGSKMRLVRDYGGTLRDLVKIRRLHRHLSPLPQGITARPESGSS
ncbi:MAG: glycosyltransferase family 2 protein [Armatimonadetes bacterium]|nr:glycosyltransferase family 2 protein [Armatimonadota bacterium]